MAFIRIEKFLYYILFTVYLVKFKIVEFILPVKLNLTESKEIHEGS